MRTMLLPATLLLLAAPLRAQGTMTTIATVGDSTSIIEDLSWDAAGRRFLVSDVHNRRLRSVTLDGHVADVGPALAPGWGMLGVAVDSARRVAWVTAVTLPHVAGYTRADSGRAAILRMDLRTGAIQKRFDLPAPSRAAPGDLVIADNHDVYAGDGMVGAVYAIGAADTLATLVPVGRMRSTQQPALLEDGTLLVPWYGRGLMRVDRSSGALLGLIAPPAGRSLAGIDGLVRRGHELFAVYNGDNPNAILRLTLDSTQTAVQRIDTVATGADAADLNHVALVDGALYAIVQAGWSRYDDDGALKAGAHERARIVRLTF